MTARFSRRRGFGARRRRRPAVREGGRSTLINLWRLVGVFVALASVAAFGWLLTNDDFNLRADGLHITGLRYTSAEEVRAVIGLPAGATPNIFRVDTGSMERALASLPAIERADVDVVLPDQLAVAIKERTPVFLLRTPTVAFLVDQLGVALDDVQLPDAANVGLPVVNDARVQFAPVLEVGSRLDEISLAADLRLAALTPEAIGSSYTSLTVDVGDDDGYVLTAEPGGWRAIFGHYTQTLRPVDILDRQVECLRARVALDETEIAVIYLAPLEDRCGTYLPRATPRASASPPSSR